ncbi:MAG TPA: ComF family protein [Candidatus Pacearchaeota archaeon]|nr:ComF family protein [Candidatus Pacearchaeota archaeon]HOK94458.1 ComF family protein [Candidatus Pacearchaeota archaeon]HPO75516.1 ComF family protein [Candidatus Pacearchaeota archaeon]
MNIGVALLDFLFPKFCLGCGKEKTYFCPECFAKIKIFSAPICPYCERISPTGKICKDCQKNLTGFIAAGPYQDELLRKIIDVFKYQFVKELATPLALFIWKFLEQNQEIEFVKNPLDFLLVPIPLHQRRKRERGFNQSEEIGKVLSPLLKIPMQNDILVRKKYTKPQAKLKIGREENIKDAFKINQNIKIGSLQNKKIILLDDVATTLSTLEEAGKVLKESGIKEIWGLTVAKG